MQKPTPKELNDLRSAVLHFLELAGSYEKHYGSDSSVGLTHPDPSATRVIAGVVEALLTHRGERVAREKRAIRTGFISDLVASYPPFPETADGLQQRIVEVFRRFGEEANDDVLDELVVDAPTDLDRAGGAENLVRRVLNNHRIYADSTYRHQSRRADGSHSACKNPFGRDSRASRRPRRPTASDRRP